MLYTIKIIETLVREVEIEAPTSAEAMYKVRDAYKSCEIALDAGDFCDVEFRYV